MLKGVSKSTAIITKSGQFLVTICVNYTTHTVQYDRFSLKLKLEQGKPLLSSLCD